MTVHLYVSLWEHPGRTDDLASFEDAVLALLPIRGGRLLARDRVLDRLADHPLEVQLIVMPDEKALAVFLADPVRADLSRIHHRDVIIAWTQLLRVKPAD